MHDLLATIKLILSAEAWAIIKEYAQDLLDRTTLDKDQVSLRFPQTPASRFPPLCKQYLRLTRPDSHNNGENIGAASIIFGGAVSAFTRYTIN